MGGCDYSLLLLDAAAMSSAGLLLVNMRGGTLILLAGKPSRFGVASVVRGSPCSDLLIHKRVPCLID